MSQTPLPPNLPPQEPTREQTHLSSPPTRFELELEFVSMLSSPHYVHWLASNKYLQAPEFVAYLRYLRYWTRQPYVRYLTHPGPTLRILELLQEDGFRADVIRPDVVGRVQDELMEAAGRRGE